jgi:hypothetical protein
MLKELLTTLRKILSEHHIIDLLTGLDILTQIFLAPIADLKGGFGKISLENYCITLLIICPIVHVKATLEGFVTWP